ncbi:MAG: hypothetical protein QXF26_10650, partial [Candidatus Bathyarchaeia archaeon]
MTYRKVARQSYAEIRRKPYGAKLKSSLLSSPKTSLRHQRFTANLMDMSRFLAGYLSGKKNIIISTDQRRNAGYSVKREEVRGKTYYHIKVPNWSTYSIPVKTEEEKYRIYRNGIWHESCHGRYTPDQVYSYGVSVGIKDTLGHDVINIIEDRRVEDLGVEYWEGSGPERAFVNAYAYSLRPSVGELWKDLVEGKDLNEDWVKKRRARVIHEAFLQRLLVGKIKDGTDLPTEEWLKVQEAASHVENQLEKMKKYKGDTDKVYADLERLTKYVIEKLGLIGFEPEIREFGKNSWDQTFTEDYGRS